jgi:hypothetical protein
MVTVFIPAGPRAAWAFDNATLHNSASRRQTTDGGVELVFSSQDSRLVVEFWQAYAANS